MVDEAQRQRTNFQEFTPKLVSNAEDALRGFDHYDRTFPTQSMADRFDYGYGQTVGNMTSPDGSIDPWRHRDDGNDFYNPQVIGNIYGGGPDGIHNRGARLAAEQFNYPSVTENFDYVGSQNDLLDMIAWNNALEAGEIDVDEMYIDEDPAYSYMDPELFMTQEEQVADEPSAFIKTLMENYGRGNPYMQNLSGTYNNYFGETFGMDEDQVGARDVMRGWQNYAADNADMIRDRQINREYPLYNDPILNMVEEERPTPNILYREYLERNKNLNMEDIFNKNMKMYDDSNLGNYDLFHLMQNGYSLEEAQQILSEQGLA